MWYHPFQYTSKYISQLIALYFIFSLYIIKSVFCGPMAFSSTAFKVMLICSFMITSQSFVIVTRKWASFVLSSKSNDGFDPLLSPHTYAKGTDYGPIDSNDPGTKYDNIQDEDKDEWSPLKLRNVKKDFEGASLEEYTVQKSSFTHKWATSVKSVEAIGSLETKQRKNKKISAELFDPLLSPHAYPLGTDAGAVPVEQEVIGVLIIDHGSKRASSNERLHMIAEMYQSRAPDNYVVKAAHMEIAEPSIYNGIKALCDEGIHTIICHPYFLSPGRHVQEDVPQLIEEASLRLKQEGVSGDLNVITTEAVGSDLELIVDLIQKKIEDSIGIQNMKVQSGFVTKSKNKEFGVRGGFFGEIQRMIDEQL